MAKKKATKKTARKHPKKGARRSHPKKGARRGSKRRAHKTEVKIPNITSMAKRVGKALGAGLKRPAGAALKKAKGKTATAKAVRSIGHKLAPKKRAAKRRGK